jgi:hypothetical protein
VTVSVGEPHLGQPGAPDVRFCQDLRTARDQIRVPARSSQALQHLGQQFRLRQRHEVPTRQHQRFHSQAPMCYFLLQRNGEKPIVSATDDVHRRVPAIEVTDRPEDRGALLVLVDSPTAATTGSTSCRKEVSTEKSAGIVKPTWSHHSSGRSPGTGTIALTSTTARSGTRAATIAAVKPPRDCAAIRSPGEHCATT